MLNADPLLARPTLTHPGLIASALERLGAWGADQAEVWRLLTESYAVDLDAVAALMPRAEPEPIWLDARA